VSVTPLLDRLSGPDDLRRLDREQLAELATEVRRFIVEAVARTGGHLGSNLGAVELTFALHRVFDSPHDILLWDTGHQAYVHKLVTGRQDGFARLRQAGGLSGYPCRAESVHDWVENSHASTVLSYAYGMATALELAGPAAVPHGRTDPGAPARRVVAVIGDGAMTGGMAFEALNNLGHSGRQVVIVVNDNGRSYAPTIGKLADSLARLRLDPRYVKRRAMVERLLADVPVVGETIQRGLDSAAAAVREMLEPPVFFETLGVRYTGPFDGHDVEGMESALRHACTYDGPIVVHVLTQKGRGYGPAEQDEEQHLHDASVFDPETGTPRRHAAPSFTAAFSEELVRLGADDERIVAITAAMPGSTGVLPFEERFPTRCVDVGIAEQHAVTAAAGMAMGGLRPVVAIYSTFLTRAFDQVHFDVGLHDLPVVFVVDRAGITGDNGASHHGVLDLALLTKVPGMTVLAPSSYQEVQVMLRDALAITDGPVAIRFPRGSAPQVTVEEIGAGLAGRRVRTGDAVCLLAVGKMLAAASHAADILEAEGVSTTVWDVRCVKPLDPDLLRDAARHPVVVTVEDGVREGGAGSAITDAIGELAACEPAADGQPPRVVVLGTPDRFIAQGRPDDILADLGLDGPGVAASALHAIAGRTVDDRSFDGPSSR
jgi:1-deoxy-D-xylulose-5-phosphate synthase